MKKIQFNILMAFAILSFVSLTNAQWKKIPVAPGKAMISCVATDSNHVYAGTNFGEIYALEKGKNSWKQIYKPSDNASIPEIISNDTAVFAEYGRTIIYVNIQNGNSGDTYSPLSGGCILYTICSMAYFNNSLFITASDQSYIYARKVYYDGYNWEGVNDSLNGAHIIAFSKYKNQLYGASADSGLFVLSGDETYWRKCKSGLANIKHFAIADSVFFVTDNKNIYYSNYSDSSWKPLPNVPVGSDYESMKAFGKYLFVKYGSALYKSSDYGAAWSLCNINKVNAAVNSYCMQGDKLIIGTDIGVYMADINSMQWTDNNDSLSQAEVYSVCEGSKNLFASTSMGLHYSTDGGVSWRMTSLPQNQVYKLYSRSSHIFAAADSGLYKSSDDGKTWEADTNTVVRSYSLIIDDNNLYNRNDKTIYRSTDWGQTWGVPLTLSLLQISRLTIKGNIIFATDYNNATYCSKDYGSTWHISSISRLDASIAGIAICDTILFAIQGRGGFYDPSGIFRSTDYGTTWKDQKFAYAINIVSNDKYVLVSAEGDVLFSDDKGDKWKSIIAGMNAPYFSSLAIGSAYLYGASEWGLWKIPISEITAIKDNKNTLPDKYLLKQNYPNPFNPVTNIVYSVAKEGRVKIVVYNILGQAIKELVNENKSAGVYQAQFNCAGLSSGVYFYRTESGGFTETKKMIIQK
jgi:photosystem II stability/assembly factor-like uncharacterized protein